MKRWHRDLRKLARRYDADLTYTCGGHIRLVREHAPDVVCSSTPRKPEIALRYIEADLRRYSKDQ